MSCVDKLKDEAEILRVWMKFWLNIVIAIFVGFASIVYSYAVDKIKLDIVSVLFLVLLTFFIFIANIVIVIRENQLEITERIGDAKC